MIPVLWIQEVVRRALLEDLGTGDVSVPILQTPQRFRANIVAKSHGILAGMAFVREAFEAAGGQPTFEHAFADGTAFEPGAIITRFEADAAALLAGERTALNFLGHLSGIASHTRHLVNQLPPTVRLAATRKTTPGLRAAEKYAVKIGGGFTHRNGLDDMVLLKENHLRVAGGIGPAVAQLRPNLSHHLKIEVEVTNLQEVGEALKARADIIMLDNFRPDQIPEAVALIAGRALVEVSGNLGEHNMAQYAQPGVDIISMGSLTGGVHRADFSLQADFHPP